MINYVIGKEKIKINNYGKRIDIVNNKITSFWKGINYLDDNILKLIKHKKITIEKIEWIIINNKLLKLQDIYNKKEAYIIFEKEKIWSIGAKLPIEHSLIGYDKNNECIVPFLVTKDQTFTHLHQ